MKLVVDANELFAAIITRGKEHNSWTLDALFSEKVELYAPYRLLAELEKHSEEIKSKSGFSSRDFEAFMGILSLRIHFTRLDEFRQETPEALKLAPHPKDAEYFALALKLGCAILSEEKSFKKQSKI
ncbi:MAG: PIN domain-containing protein [Chloroflexi bacterium]|nr:PIN domain-containing protein [Chloroflexota bacterium]